MPYCSNCGRELSNELSIARGYGPECAMLIKNSAKGQLDMFSSRALYQYGTSPEGDILWLVDEGKGAIKSLTNDIETALKEIEETEGDLVQFRHIIYRDSTGTWDGVTWNSKTKVAWFYGIDEMDREKAFTKARERANAN